MMPPTQTLHTVVEEIIAGLKHISGERLDTVNHMHQWFYNGHRKAPTGRFTCCPVGAKDSYKRAPFKWKGANGPPAV